MGKVRLSSTGSAMKKFSFLAFFILCPFGCSESRRLSGAEKNWFYWRRTTFTASAPNRIPSTIFAPNFRTFGDFYRRKVCCWKLHDFLKGICCVRPATAFCSSWSWALRAVIKESKRIIAFDVLQAVAKVKINLSSAYERSRGYRASAVVKRKASCFHESTSEFLHGEVDCDGVISWVMHSNQRFFHENHVAEKIVSLAPERGLN